MSSLTNNINQNRDTKIHEPIADFVLLFLKILWIAVPNYP